MVGQKPFVSICFCIVHFSVLHLREVGPVGAYHSQPAGGLDAVRHLAVGISMFMFFVSCSISSSCILSSPFFLPRPAEAVTQINHRVTYQAVGSSPPTPRRHVPCTFIARRLHSALPSLVDSRDKHTVCQCIPTTHSPHKHIACEACEASLAALTALSRHPAMVSDIGNLRQTCACCRLSYCDTAIL